MSVIELKQKFYPYIWNDNLVDEYTRVTDLSHITKKGLLETLKKNKHYKEGDLVRLEGTNARCVSKYTKTGFVTAERELATLHTMSTTAKDGFLKMIKTIRTEYPIYNPGVLVDIVKKDKFPMKRDVYVYRPEEPFNNETDTSSEQKYIYDMRNSEYGSFETHFTEGEEKIDQLFFQDGGDMVRYTVNDMYTFVPGDYELMIPKLKKGDIMRFTDGMDFIYTGDKIGFRKVEFIDNTIPIIDPEFKLGDLPDDYWNDIYPNGIAMVANSSEFNDIKPFFINPDELMVNHIPTRRTMIVNVDKKNEFLKHITGENTLILFELLTGRLAGKLLYKESVDRRMMWVY